MKDSKTLYIILIIIIFFLIIAFIIFVVLSKSNNKSPPIPPTPPTPPTPSSNSSFTIVRGNDTTGNNIILSGNISYWIEPNSQNVNVIISPPVDTTSSGILIISNVSNTNDILVNHTNMVDVYNFTDPYPIPHGKNLIFIYQGNQIQFTPFEA